MRRLRISKGGQVSLPAEIRHRWLTGTVSVEDRGDHAVLRPVSDDPVEATRGLWRGVLSEPSEEMRAGARADEGQSAKRRR